MFPLEQPEIVAAVERAATAHLGRSWTARRFTDLNDRASHQAGIFHGAPFSVFVKLGQETEQLTAELRGLDLIREQAGVATPKPVAMVKLDGGALLLLEAVPEIAAAARTADQWRSIGRALATLHTAHHQQFGLTEFDGFFGPLSQDNRPVQSNRWADFYTERRLIPRLRPAVDSGYLPPELAVGVEKIAARLPALCGPEPQPSLLHGDAQQNNFLTASTGTYLLDTAPYFGHPEIDLALVDYFSPVPATVFDGYRDITPIDPEFTARRELWRLFAYLAVVTVDGRSDFGRRFVRRIADAVALYR